MWRGDRGELQSPPAQHATAASQGGLGVEGAGEGGSTSPYNRKHSLRELTQRERFFLRCLPEND